MHKFRQILIYFNLFLCLFPLWIVIYFQFNALETFFHYLNDDLLGPDILVGFALTIVAADIVSLIVYLTLKRKHIYKPTRSYLVWFIWFIFLAEFGFAVKSIMFTTFCCAPPPSEFPRVQPVLNYPPQIP